MAASAIRRLSTRTSSIDQALDKRATVEHFRSLSVPDSLVDMDSTSKSALAPSVSNDDAASVTTPPTSPALLSRNVSFSNSSSFQEDWEAFPPLDRLTVFDLLDNFHIPRQLEKWQRGIAAQTEKVKRQREKLRTRGSMARERVVEEWRKRLPTAEEQLDKYRRRMRSSVEKLGSRWNDTRIVTAREKMSFIAGVLNIFISGYLIGGYPQYFYLWFTSQLCYFMPIRWYTYHKRGYHYFLADLCYFVNGMLMLSIWVFPQSKRLLIATYCLAYGNNAIAIVMWRNSMVFHSLDKVTSLFIHIMPPVTLHCMVHLTPSLYLKDKFPAIYAIKHSEANDPIHYTLWAMMLWASVPYFVWQLSYHFFITVGRAEKIAAGRPTSFTWLRRSYSKVWIGKFVLSLPDALQEPAFMGIQYVYALLTMTPCPLWFWYRYLSVAFLVGVFIWSIYNGATYYIDVFGKRFQSELETLRADVAKWQGTNGLNSAAATPYPLTSTETGQNEYFDEKTPLATSPPKTFSETSSAPGSLNASPNIGPKEALYMNAMTKGLGSPMLNPERETRRASRVVLPMLDGGVEEVLAEEDKKMR